MFFLFILLGDDDDVVTLILGMISLLGFLSDITINCKDIKASLK